MKKKLLIVVCVVGLMMSMVGCGVKEKCDFCAKETYCKSYEVWGTEAHICKDCENAMNQMFQ